MIGKEVPQYVVNLMNTNPTKYFEIVPPKDQEAYIDYAIGFLTKYLRGLNKLSRDCLETQCLKRMKIFKLDRSYEHRYGIKERIKREKNYFTRKLMEEIEDDYMRCDFIDSSDIALSMSDKSRSKYGDGIARFASIILAREEARIRIMHQNDRREIEKDSDFKYIRLIRERLIVKCKEIRETFAHDDRGLQKILNEQFAEDMMADHKSVPDDESV